MIVIESRCAPCLLCRHLKKGFECDAFPDGIPDEIIGGKNRHTTPLPDQGNDIVFKLFKEAEAEN